MLYATFKTQDPQFLWSLDAIWKKGLVKKEIVWYYIQALR